MTTDLTVYEKPTCTKCRALAQLLEEEGVEFERVNYYVEPLSAERLRELLAKAGLEPRDVLRGSDPEHDELSGEELIELLVREPDLLQRPIVERGDRAVLARPAERVRELLR